MFPAIQAQDGPGQGAPANAGRRPVPMECRSPRPRFKSGQGAFRNVENLSGMVRGPDIVGTNEWRKRVRQRQEKRFDRHEDRCGEAAGALCTERGAMAFRRLSWTRLGTVFLGLEAGDAHDMRGEEGQKEYEKRLGHSVPFSGAACGARVRPDAWRLPSIRSPPDRSKARTQNGQDGPQSWNGGAHSRIVALRRPALPRFPIWTSRFPPWA